MRYIVDITTDASGDGTGSAQVMAPGHINAIRYVPDGTSPFATGVDVVMTLGGSGMPVWTEENLGTNAIVRAPRLATHSILGAAALYAAAGAAVLDRIPVDPSDRLSFVVAAGGDTKTGRFYVWVTP